MSASTTSTSSSSTINEADRLFYADLPPTFDPLAPELAVATTVHRTMDHTAHAFDDARTIEARLRVFTQAVENGDLSHVRRMLASQMVMLERLAHHFTLRMASYKTSPTDYERLGKLAMRAQTQLARTAMILQSMTNANATTTSDKPKKPAAVIGRVVPPRDQAKQTMAAPGVKTDAPETRAGEVVLRG